MSEESNVNMEALKSIIQNTDRDTLLEKIGEIEGVNPELLDLLKGYMNNSQSKSNKDAVSNATQMIDTIKPFLNNSQTDKISQLMPILSLISNKTSNENSISKEGLKKELKEEILEELKNEIGRNSGDRHKRHHG